MYQIKNVTHALPLKDLMKNMIAFDIYGINNLNLCYNQRFTTSVLKIYILVQRVQHFKDYYKYNNCCLQIQENLFRI